MKKFVALIATIGAVALGMVVLTGCTSAGSGSAVTNVDAPTFLSTASQPGVVVLDVRTAGEYAAGHLTDAVNVDVEAPTFDSQIAKLDKGTTYAVYCHSGRRSALATDAMAQAGFTQLSNLSGGISDLAAAGGTVVTS